MFDPRASAALVAALVAALPSIAAETHREHGAHVHGTASLNVAVDGDSLLIELDSPAANILGFEHEPRTDAEHAALDQARARLDDGAALFRPSADAKCELSGSEIDLSLGEHEHHEHEDGDKHEHAAGHAHDEGAEHEHDHDGGEVHADIHAEYAFTCERPASLEALDVRLFEAFPATEQVRVQVITPAGQGAADLTPDKTEVRL